MLCAVDKAGFTFIEFLEKLAVANDFSDKRICRIWHGQSPYRSDRLCTHRLVGISCHAILNQLIDSLISSSFPATNACAAQTLHQVDYCTSVEFNLRFCSDGGTYDL